MNKRTATVLRAIIDEYVKSAEPVGSNSILSKYDFHVSSATIRNEMVTLERDGYIHQPHTSAGRIPTEKGYRYYVDHMVTETEQMRYLDQIISKILLMMEMDKAIEHISLMLSNYTEYASLGMAKQDRICTVQSIHILSFNEEEYVLVIILDNKKVAHRIVRTERDEEIKIDLISAYINDKVAKKTVDEIEQIDFDLIEIFNAKNKHFIQKVIQEIVSTLRENESYTYCVRGYEKLLAYPEFQHSMDAKEVFEALNNKEELYELLSHRDNAKLNISIGSENAMTQLSKISIATRTIDLGENGNITLGIAGPIRMNYRKVVLSFADIGKMLDKLISKE